jgi:hypothetical protein
MTSTTFTPAGSIRAFPVPAAIPLQGATSLISGMYVHEFVHDGRHLLGFPCH